MWIRAGILMVAVAASVAAPVALRHRAQAEWREKAALQQERAGQLEAALAENRRLSDLVAQARSSPAASSGELRELLRLRGEIGRLRQAVSEMEKLKATNQWLLTVAGTLPGQPGASPPPEGETVEAYWPKAQLVAAGYADPASALRTALWAMTRGDAGSLAMSVTPEARASMERQDWLEHKSAAEEMAERGRWIAESLGPISGFYVVGQQLTAEDRAIVDVHFEGEGKARKFEMKKVGSEWKLSAMGMPGGTDSGSAWP